MKPVILLVAILTGSICLGQNPNRNGDRNSTAPSAQQAPDMAVCEDGHVNLGQTKQQVKVALALCCRIELQPPINGLVDENTFRVTGRTNSDCGTTFLGFDGSDRLAYADRSFTGYAGPEANDFSTDLIRGFSDLMRYTPVIPRSGSPDVMDRIAPAQVELLAAGGPQAVTEIFILVGQLVLEINVNDIRGQKMISVSEKIGDTNKAVRSEIPANK